MTPVSIKEGNRRLLELADLLEDIPEVHREGDELRGYKQSAITHPCGSPACAWGHWILSTSGRLRRALAVVREGHGGIKRVFVTMDNGDTQTIKIPTIEAADAEFNLNSYERNMLFGEHGCGLAKTGAEAAIAIRRFVDARSPRKPTDPGPVMGLGVPS